MSGLKTDEDTNQLPTIVIVASYDTFGAAPVSTCNDKSQIMSAAV